MTVPSYSAKSPLRPFDFNFSRRMPAMDMEVRSMGTTDQSQAEQQGIFPP